MRVECVKCGWVTIIKSINPKLVYTCERCGAKYVYSLVLLESDKVNNQMLKQIKKELLKYLRS